MLIETVAGYHNFCVNKVHNDFLTIKIDGKVVFNVFDGEPEDNTLSTNFLDCYNIPKLLKRAFTAGKLDGELILKDVEVDTWEEYKSFLKEGNV